VAGDLNDGPGLDDYERLFGRSGVEIVMGGPDEVQLYDPHAERALQSRIAAQPTTARFFIAHEERWLAALLDYIMVSPPCAPMARRWRIWHPFDDPACWPTRVARCASRRLGPFPRDAGSCRTGLRALFVRGAMPILKGMRRNLTILATCLALPRPPWRRARAIRNAGSTCCGRARA
jgi:hypothetical protein